MGICNMSFSCLVYQYVLCLPLSNVIDKMKFFLSQHQALHRPDVFGGDIAARICCLQPFKENNLIHIQFGSKCLHKGNRIISTMHKDILVQNFFSGCHSIFRQIVGFFFFKLFSPFIVFQYTFSFEGSSSGGVTNDFIFCFPFLLVFHLGIRDMSM